MHKSSAGCILRLESSFLIRQCSLFLFVLLSPSFDLDLANNLEVEFLVYSWDPQLRHRLCYRSSLRLSTLFGKGQSFQQVALREAVTANFINAEQANNVCLCSETCAARIPHIFNKG